jgi:hypothetical protein
VPDDLVNAHDFLAHLNALPTFELLKMFDDGKLEALAEHSATCTTSASPTPRAVAPTT